MNAGFGWRLVAFDPATRSGAVALGPRLVRFAAEAAADEELRVGDEVFVRLHSTVTPEPHVVRVWPCLARLAHAGGPRAPAPTLAEPIAAAAARTLSQLPRMDTMAAIAQDDGALALVAYDLDADAYGLAGYDVTVHGALRCTGVRLAPTRPRIHPVLVRLADDDERAWVHAAAPLRAETLVIALVERRDEFSPTRDDAALVPVACDALTWQPGPSRARAQAAATALATTPDAAAVTVADGWLLARVHGVAERVLALADADEAAAFAPWCDAVNAVLRAADDDDDDATRAADAARAALEQAIADAAAPFAPLAEPSARVPEPAVLASVLRAFASVLDALATWLERMDHAGVTIGPAPAPVPALHARLGAIAGVHAELVRARVAQPPAWHAVIDLYTEFAYCGGTHGGGALLTRLHDGRRWRPDDVSTLRALVDRARALAAASA